MCYCFIVVPNTMEFHGNVLDWSVDKVASWLSEKGHSKYVELLCKRHQIDGRVLLLITENDLKGPPLNIMVLGDVKRLALDIRQLKIEVGALLLEHGYDPQTLLPIPKSYTGLLGQVFHQRFDIDSALQYPEHFPSKDVDQINHHHSSSQSPPPEGKSENHLKPELWKAFIALGYCFVVTWITAFVMVIVHDRVPDMKKYPPLPDIFLDNVPHIPWAFHMCEWVGTLMLFIWLTVLVFHRHRFILLRRFFALSGTVFLLRCVTMLITSLSVPGTHLQCTPKQSKDGMSDLLIKIKEAYIIWKGAGMSIQGVRTCGDYMFSGHTVALTMLNFFITEYSPRDIYLLHTFTWLLNMFGIFFILSGHEHYSIDVFIAFYITSRLFLYYHTLANNQSLMQRDTGRTRIWFPLFSFFEASVDSIVPNEYDSPLDILHQLINFVRTTVSRLIFLFHANLTLRPRSSPPPSSSNPYNKKKKK